MLTNPILPGFHPDPSILRVGEDYYLATSTFEWFPGVEIHHSRDLVHWELYARPLTRIDLCGIPYACGIWAPCLSHDGERFYLVYTIVRSTGGPYKDTHNYLVTAEELRGEWSEPVYLHSCGFDPSLFHDEDGRKWLVSMAWDYRPDRHHFAGILLQEYDPSQRRLIGEEKNIFRGTSLQKTEGPHLYHHGDWYYLLTAEGGTGLGHAVTMARARELPGPYEVHPENPVLTSRYNPSLCLQKAGHADLVETQTGAWYMVHLCTRPLDGCSILGRETAMQSVEWGEDGWLRLAQGGHEPAEAITAPALPPHPFEVPPVRDDFDASELGAQYRTLRMALSPDTLSLTDRPGHLRLYGAESLHSLFRQALVARRQEAFCYTAATRLAFSPADFRRMAGLICLHDDENYFYLFLSHDEEKGRSIGVAVCDNGTYSYTGLDALDDSGYVILRVQVRYRSLRFSYSTDGEAWRQIGERYDTGVLSDEHSRCSFYTGAFVGMCCQDLSGGAAPADFDWFEYREET